MIRAAPQRPFRLPEEPPPRPKAIVGFSRAANRVVPDLIQLARLIGQALQRFAAC
jgi:hypothetical protein